jgi:hypothetical protein
MKVCNKAYGEGKEKGRKKYTKKADKEYVRFHVLTARV